MSRQLDAIFVAPTLQLQNRTCKPSAIFNAICRRDIAGVSNMFELVATLARQKLHRVAATRIACVNGPLHCRQNPQYKISRRYLVDIVKKLVQKACCTCSMLIFPNSTNQFIDLWRCRSRCRRHFFREQGRRQRQRRRQKTML